jgi:hypothetical protein
MPIPTAFDHQLADVEIAATGITSLIRTMHFCGDARAVSGMRSRLRSELQAFVDKAMALADESGK